VDATSTHDYCFLVYPFVYEPLPGGTFSRKTYKTGLVPKCVRPVITPPTNIQFTGFSVANANTCDSTNLPLYGTVVLNWTAPVDPVDPTILAGVFNQYEIYYAEGLAADFHFADATSATPPKTYTRIIIDSTKSTYTETNLAPSKTYTFGIRTLYQSPVLPYRSDDNSGFITCTFL
jgi:hypothetical protein